MYNKAKHDYLAKMFKAISHPTRVLLIDALKDGEKCVCELQSLTDVGMPTISKHLKILKNVNIVTSWRDKDNRVYYRLIFPCVLKLFDCLLPES